MTLNRENIRRILVGLCLFTIILFATISRIDSHNRTFRSWDPAMVGYDAISLWDHRLKAMLPYLPSHGVVGYRDDRSVPGREVDNLDASGEYTLTRYALAPLILKDDSKSDLVVGNFSFGNTAPPFESMGYTVIKQFDFELYLLKRASK